MKYRANSQLSKDERPASAAAFLSDLLYRRASAGAIMTLIGSMILAGFVVYLIMRNRHRHYKELARRCRGEAKV